MPFTIRIRYSLKRDQDNYLHSLYRFDRLKHGRKDIQKHLLKPFPEDFKKKLSSATDERGAREIISKFLAYFTKKQDKKIKYSIKQLENAWKIYGERIEKKLVDLYRKPILFTSLTIYLTTIPICPYNLIEKWIMVFYGASVNKKLDIILHELNHFMFLHYFGDLKKQLGLKKFESLKESLTIFTNPEEPGYPAHQKLRDYLKKLESKTIPEILPAATKFLKNNFLP